MTTGDRWTDARRIEAWAGEVRVNLVRLAAILIFYTHHLINVYLIRDETIPEMYHATVTVLVIVWTGAAGVLHVCLTRRWVSPEIKYVSTLWDIVLATVLLAVTPDGPKSALTVLYFLIIASTALRLSLALVYVATVGSGVAYLLLLGYYFYAVIGAENYYSSPQRVQRTQEIIFWLGLLAAGALAGQSVRQARRLVRGYAVAVAENPEEQP
jgi:hypothetical protein